MGHLLGVAKERLAAMGRLGAAHEASVELLEWPSEPTYDLINAQWVAMYLTDNDLVAFLKSAKQALRRNGTARRRLTTAELKAREEAAAAEGTLPYMRRRLAALGRRGRDVLSDAEAREYDRLEDAIEAAEMAEKKKRKNKQKKKDLRKKPIDRVEGDSDNKSFVNVTTTGVIFLKENIFDSPHVYAIKGATSLNRCDAHFRAAFKAAGLTVLHHAMQREWPSTNVALGMYALVPASE